MDDKNPVGRPTKYKEEYCEMIVEHMTNGDSAISFAKTIDVCMATLTQWQKDFPEFSVAYKKGQNYCEDHWMKEGQKGMWNTPGQKTLNTGVWAFYMKARFGWKDRQEISMGNADDDDGLTINFSKKEG
jgi:hypothetical protein